MAAQGNKIMNDFMSFKITLALYCQMFFLRQYFFNAICNMGEIIAVIRPF